MTRASSDPVTGLVPSPTPRHRGAELRALALLVAFLILPSATVAAQEMPGYGGAKPAAEASGQATHQMIPPSDQGPAGGHSLTEIVFSISVLAWGLVLIGGLTWVMVRSGEYWNPNYVRLSILGIVVTAGLFVIVAGYTEHQIAPMMGLLGTLVGYLLGKGTDGKPAPPADGA